MNEPPSSYSRHPLPQKRLLRGFWPIAAAVVVLCATIAVYASDDGTSIKNEIRDSSRTPEDNLLYNPSFEGQYSAYIPPAYNPDCPAGICQTAQMASGWTPWWKLHNPADDPWIFRMPEYKPAELSVPPPPRVRTGERAQQYFTFWSTHIAGFYQRVPVENGRQYCFTIWGHSWSSSDDNPWTSDNALFQRIGIDPFGGTDWQSGNIEWSATRQQPNEYGYFYACSIARSNYLTVFTFSQPEWAVKHNDVYWDDAVLMLYEPNLLIHPSDGITFFADVDQPGFRSRLIDIEAPTDPWVYWNAEVESGGSIVPTLSTLVGSGSDDLTITVDTSGLTAGTYHAAVTLTSTPYLTGSPVTIPITVSVVGDLYDTEIPLLTN